jgi:pimeloyl-ACP methyl ester carboxylesterase
MEDGVVLLHGILRTPLSMVGFARFFKKWGFRVLNLGYPSRKHDLAVLLNGIHDPIQRFRETFSGKIHFVGYSMGGLLVRAYLNRYGIRGLGRVVLIGTPNGGSEVADYLQNRFLYQWVFGPAGQQLITDQRGFQHLFSPLKAEIGIIAGNKSMPPFGFTMAGTDNDGKVSVVSTHLMEEKDHLTLPTSHMGLLFHPKVRAQMLAFIMRGTFDRP